MTMSVVEQKPVLFACRRCRLCGERYEFGMDKIARVFAPPARPAGEDGAAISRG